MHSQINILSKKILYWYDNNKRLLPWRVSLNFKKMQYYRILSEFMLQQTQVKTVIPYFNKFIKKIPTLEALSKTKRKEVLKLWEGLGYYRRAKNLHLTSKILVKIHKGILPVEYNLILGLPGVGSYTANALSAFIYNKPTIALDANVKRVFSRVLNKNEKKIDFEKFIINNKKLLFKSNRNSDFAEGMIEFGALICKPKIPQCFNCNITNICKYFNSKKKITKIRYLKINKKNYDIFCYLNKKNKKIALTKSNNLGFLNNFKLPIMQETNNKIKNKNWNFLCNYSNSISNKKLNINLYYKFSNKLPHNLNWHSLNNNKEFIPTFTKNIFKQVSKLFI